MERPSVQIFSSARWADVLRGGSAAEASPASDWQVIDRLAQIRTAEDAAALLLLDDTLLEGAGRERLQALPAGVVVVAEGGAAERLARSAGRLFLVLPAGSNAEVLNAGIEAGLLHARSQLSMAKLRKRHELAARDVESLAQIGAALMKVGAAEELLGKILSEARRITSSDAGTLYLVDEDRLRFRLTQNDSLPGLDPPDFAIPLDRASFAGYAATTGETVRIDDAYAIPEGAPYRFDRRFDVANGYRTGAVLVVPMVEPTGETVGVLQLLNPKAGAYTNRDERLARALGGQAAVALDNQRLRQDIEALFEGFIRASVSAIDQRDPGTSGHSARVADMTCELARRVDRSGSRVFGGLSFGREALRELRYAALLHDFGKVFVPEAVLGKDRKLPRDREVRVAARFEQAAEILETNLQRERARYLLECGEAGFELFEKNLEQVRENEREKLSRFQAAVARANEPRVLPDEAPAELAEVARHRLVGADGQMVSLLEETDVAFLSVERGSLTEEEREAIQSHVLYTHRFLAQIPWTRDLGRVDAIASAHHEKLDGSGYPRGLAGGEIPIEARMLTIADIYDALTAADRPYKRALPRERALDILHAEAERGRVDEDLLAVFCASAVWRILD